MKFDITINHNHYHNNDSQRIDEILRIVKHTSQKLEHFMALEILQELVEKVRRNSDRTDSLITLLNGIAQKLKDLIASNVSRAEVIEGVAAVVAELDAQDSEIVAAVDANTPTPVEPPNPGPVTPLPTDEDSPFVPVEPPPE